MDFMNYSISSFLRLGPEATMLGCFLSAVFALSVVRLLGLLRSELMAVVLAFGGAIAIHQFLPELGKTMAESSLLFSFVTPAAILLVGWLKENW